MASFSLLGGRKDIFSEAVAFYGHCGVFLKIVIVDHDSIKNIIQYFMIIVDP